MRILGKSLGMPSGGEIRRGRASACSCNGESMSCKWTARQVSEWTGRRTIISGNACLMNKETKECYGIVNYWGT